MTYIFDLSIRRIIV